MECRNEANWLKHRTWRGTGSRTSEAAQSAKRSVLIGVSVLLLGATLLAPPAAAQAVATAPKPAPAPTAATVPQFQPSPQDAQVARVIAALMPGHHISGEELNDKISGRALKLFIEALDPQKLYFYQQDVVEFSRESTQIDDMVRRGDLSLGYRIFRRYAQRVDERVERALELLDGDFSFDVDEEIVLDADSSTYASTREEADDRVRRWIKYYLLELKDNETEGEEAISQLRRRYQRQARRAKEIDSDDLLELYLSSVTMGYDPHSTYMSPGTLDDFAISMRLNLEGIGAALREKDGTTVVANVIPGGAAAKDGRLKPDDVIVSVGQGQSGEMVEIMEMPIKEVVKLIRGNAGTLVRLGVKSGGVGAVQDYVIERARVELEESAARGEVIEHEMPNSMKLKLGFINLPSFYMDMESAKQNLSDYRSSTKDVLRILSDFKEQNVDGVILDLRQNGGGSLNEAISLTGLFIDRGPVVQVKNSDGSVQPIADEAPGTAWDGPLVVLTSKFSASASEIFAGAIKDYGRGIVVGDPATHGKGTVQTLMDLGERLFNSRRENYGALKVTLQQFYLPDGKSTQRRGVAADVVLPSLSSKLDIAEGDLDYALDYDTVNATRHVTYGMTPTGLIDSLRRQSAERIEKDEEFIDLLRRIQLYVEQKERSSMTLNEEKFMKLRAEMDASKEKEKEELDQELNTEEIFRDTFYNQEVLNITHDYVQGLRQQNLAVAH